MFSPLQKKSSKWLWKKLWFCWKLKTEILKSFIMKQRNVKSTYRNHQKNLFLWFRIFSTAKVEWMFLRQKLLQLDKKPRNKCFPFYVLQCTFCLLFVGDDWDWTIARNLEIWDHIFVSGSTWELNYSLFRPAYSDMPMAQWCQSNFFVRYNACSNSQPWRCAHTKQYFFRYNAWKTWQTRRGIRENFSNNRFLK